MNHFFALEVSEEARQVICQSGEEWRGLGVTAKWSAAADYHVTLKFLGDVEKAEQRHLKEAAEPIAAAMLPFFVSPQPFGAFPNVAYPSVLWAGVANNPELDRLRIRLDRAMAGLGFRTDHRRYKPHVTVARCVPQTALIESRFPNERLFAPFIVSRFVLMQTLPPEERANGGKARYNTVHAFPFRTAH